MNVRHLLIVPFILLLAACGISSSDYVKGVASEKLFAANDAWSAAKRRGIYYRAYGDTPFWQLEINERKNLILFKSPGVADQAYAYVEPEVNIIEGKTTYRLSESKVIVIENSSCSDSTVGEQFPTTVHLTLDIYPRNGCGRKLY